MTNSRIVHLVPPLWPRFFKLDPLDSKPWSWTYEGWSNKVTLLGYNGREELGPLEHEYAVEIDGTEGILTVIPIPWRLTRKREFPLFENLVLEMAECLMVHGDKAKGMFVSYSSEKDNKGCYHFYVFCPIGTTKKIFHATMESIAVLIKKRYPGIWDVIKDR